MPVNKSQATVSGLECQTTARLGESGQASLIYTFLEAKDDLLNKHLPYQPEHQLTAHFQYGITLIKKQLEVICRLGVEYIGERYADAQEGEKLPSSIILKGKMTAKVMERVDIYLVGKNLQDKQYSLRSGYPLPGRTFYGGVSWEFWD
jgi:outer membrane cobalamin receptor